MEFQKFDKIPRLYRDIIITEKIDGTNAQICIELKDAIEPTFQPIVERFGMEVDGYVVLAGSRKRYLSLEQDNFGFAEWVSKNRRELLLLGAGRHFGEWWGKGIQRGYGMNRKVFSLFNTHKWLEDRPPCCDVVPVLYEGEFNMKKVHMCLDVLKKDGSFAAFRYEPEPYMKPEGVVVFHKHSNHLFKVTIENDGVPKSVVELALSNKGV